MKQYTRKIALVLCLLLLFSGASALALTPEDKLEIISTMGIVTGDENGNMNLEKPVTRAEFTKMVIMASNDKDKAAGVSNVSPFRDVSYTHWSAGYVKVAANNGLIVGYLDGTYRPENGIKLEEGVSILLKMLGYTSEDFEGSFPEGQLATYKSIGLSKQVAAQKGEALTRQDCVHLIYNLLTAKNKTGTVYATTLGYTVDSNGEVNLNSVIDKTVEGPYMRGAQAVTELLGAGAANATVYKNGRLSTMDSIEAYDVFYYSENLNRIWDYDTKASGRIEKIAPSTAQPSSITVSGKTYPISGSAAVYKLSSLGEFVINDTVTLILDKDSNVINVFAPETINTTLYGVVTAVGSQSFTDTNGGSYKANAATIYTTAGDTILVENPQYITKNDIVKVEYTLEGESISRVSASLSGTVNSAATAVGNFRLARDVQILDVSSFANVLIYPEMLADLKLENDQVKFFALNSAGEIDRFILNNATGDAFSYGILTAVSESDSLGTSLRGSYSYDISGASGVFSTSDTLFNVHVGPAKFAKDGASATNIKNLKGERATKITGNIAYTEDGQFTIAERVQVYKIENSKYYYTNQELTFDPQNERVTVYYDDTASHKVIRLITVEKK